MGARMPTDTAIDHQTSGQLFTREDTEAGPRWRRKTSTPRGAAGPVLADAAPRPAAHEPLGCPDPFPLSWLEMRPDWLEPREGVRIVLDGPELGRAAGYIRLHDTCYQDGTGACRIPPKVPYTAFYRGDAQVIDDNGEVREVPVGSIAVIDGHSDSRATHRHAVAHLDKPEKMKLRGVLIEDEVGLLFLGCGRPDLTRAEAVMVNQSDTSAEWWPLYEMDETGKVGLVGHDLIGIALVAAGAFRKSIPDRFKVLAAALGRELDDDEVALMFDEMARSEGYADGGCGCRETQESARSATCTCSQPVPGLHDVTVDDVIPSDWRIALSDEDLATLEAAEAPVLASPTEDMVAELQAIVADLTAQINDLRAQVEHLQRTQLQMIADDLSEEEITLPDRVDQTEAVQREMEDRIARLEARTAEQSVTPATPPPDAAGPGGMAPGMPAPAVAVA